MPTGLLVRRFLLAFAIATVAIGLAQWLKGHAIDYCIREALAWGLVTAVVYTSVLAWKLRRACAAGK
jgi:hypothetical protein